MKEARHPESDQASKILDTDFADGLGFITIKPEKDWEQVNIGLGLLESRGFNTIIERLGGKPLLDELAFAHARYGKVLGRPMKGLTRTRVLALPILRRDENH